MDKLKSNLKLILGAFIIGVTLNLFFVGRELIPSGMLGFSVIYSYKMNLDLFIVILLANIFFAALGYVCISKKKIIKSILPFLLVPFFVYLTKDISSLIDISSADFLLISIFGGVLIGIGQKYIYKEGYFATASDVILAISKEILGANAAYVNYFIDIILILCTTTIFGIEKAMYSVITMIIIEVMSSRTRLGVGDSKVFYIITEKEAEVKKYIIEELHYDITIFDVKGGFSKNKNRVLMSAIPTKDYYKLREGIREIDPKAFISITDSYELVNANVHLKK